MGNRRSRSRSPRPTYHVSSLQPSNDHLMHQLQPAVDPRPQVLWLVKQAQWEGYWREARNFGAHVEEMYLTEVEIAEGELVFPDGGVRWYTHKMIKGNPVMTQTRFRDQDRKEITYEKEIVRVIMQRSREQRVIMHCTSHHRTPARPS